MIERLTPLHAPEGLSLPGGSPALFWSPFEEAGTGIDRSPEVPLGAHGLDDSRLIELVGYLVQSLVSRPEEVEVEEFYDDAGTVFGVHVHPDDIGRIIGREGRIAGALRNLVKASALRLGTQATLEILTDEEWAELDQDRS